MRKLALEGGRRRAWQAEGTADAKALRLEPAWGVAGTERGLGWLGGKQGQRGSAEEKRQEAVLCHPCSGRQVGIYSECTEDSKQRGDVFAFTF